ncbi:PH domain-containing protein [Nocardioides sp.]|uniref:PH domain-containing protein n=1 Tax=Nocardioides sp. TaxID=35761 RepID=UPI003516C6FF
MAPDNPADVPGVPTLTLRSTGGVVLGTLGAIGGAIGAVSSLVAGDAPSWAGAWGLLLLAVVSLAVLVRPRLVAGPDRLTLVGTVRTVTLPWEAVESVVVRQVVVVRAGDRRYTSPAVSRSRRQLHRDDRAARSGGSGAAPADDLTRLGTAELTEHTLAARARDARDRAGLRRGDDVVGAGFAPVRTTLDPAWVAALAVPAVGFVLALLV